MATKPIKINGKSYELADLSDTARTLLGNLRVADRKLEALKQEIALVTVARDTYGKALRASLPGQGEKPEAGQAPAVTLN